MASAFSEATPSERVKIRKWLLAGETMAEIRRSLPGLSPKLLRQMRDEVFDPLLADPEKVKELANGPVLNPSEIVRYRRNPGRKARMARPAPVQTEMFPA